MKFLPISFVCIVIYCYSGKAQKEVHTYDDLLEVSGFMTGSFSSENQSLMDTNYFHINLCMSRIWEERKDGIWLYVEQAASTTPERPYRQRAYQLKLTDDGSNIVSKVFEIREPLRFVGGCSNFELLDKLLHSDLVERPGCEIYLSKNEVGIYHGSTPPGKCISSWRGAAYVSSDVLITPQFIETWDRGWSENGERVWGPENKGYTFEKL